MINSFISVLIIHKEGKKNKKKIEFKIIKIIVTSFITGDMFLLNGNSLCVTLHISFMNLRMHISAQITYSWFG